MCWGFVLWPLPMPVRAPGRKASNLTSGFALVTLSFDRVGSNERGELVRAGDVGAEQLAHSVSSLASAGAGHRGGWPKLARFGIVFPTCGGSSTARRNVAHVQVRFLRDSSRAVLDMPWLAGESVRSGNSKDVQRASPLTLGTSVSGVLSFSEIERRLLSRESSQRAVRWALPQ